MIAKHKPHSAASNDSLSRIAALGDERVTEIAEQHFKKHGKRIAAKAKKRSHNFREGNSYFA